MVIRNVNMQWHHTSKLCMFSCESFAGALKSISLKPQKNLPLFPVTRSNLPV
jgi:hypothetical protein